VQRLVGGVQRGYRDVSHGSELAAIVKMLVLQPEKVPNKAAKRENIMLLTGKYFYSGILTHRKTSRMPVMEVIMSLLTIFISVR